MDDITKFKMQTKKEEVKTWLSENKDTFIRVADTICLMWAASCITSTYYTSGRHLSITWNRKVVKQFAKEKNMSYRDMCKYLKDGIKFEADAGWFALTNKMFSEEQLKEITKMSNHW